MSKTFKNKHLSYSRLSRFEQCPLSFKLHYIDEKKSEPGMALVFGKLIHAVLEELIEEHVEKELIGRLSEKRIFELYRTHCAKEILTDPVIFNEGVEILQSFIKREAVVDHRNILGIEKEFRLKIGDFEILGFIDRVDQVDPETIDIIDYKSNRMLFTRDEVDHSLQMSLYHMAAQQMWPWAKNIRLTFNMLRHGVDMVTFRDEEQLLAARHYVETLGSMTENATEFPARLNANCIYCDHRAQCPAYEKALKAKQEFICTDVKDMEAVAKEREEVARLAKILDSRKKELEKIIKTGLKDSNELILGGVRYAMYNTAKKNYPFEKTLDVLAKTTGFSRESIVETVATIDNKAVEKLIKEVSKLLEKPRVLLLKAELDSVTEKSLSPRFWAKKVQK